MPITSPASVAPIDREVDNAVRSDASVVIADAIEPYGMLIDV